MFKRLFGRRKEGTEKYPGTEPHDLRMPEVDELPNIEEVFAKARKAAAGEGEQPPRSPGQHVIVVTPGRMLMFQPCPPPGSMPHGQVASIQQMISPRICIHRACGVGFRGTSFSDGGRLSGCRCADS